VSENLLIGGLMMTICLYIQCVIVAILVKFLLAMEKKKIIRPTFISSSGALMVATFFMLIGNFIQITLWSVLFFSYGEFSEFATAFYHSVVNFATLGYGDIVMSQERRLLGAMEAANGVLMLGLTASFLFTVLNVLINRALESQGAKNKRG